MIKQRCLPHIRTAGRSGSSRLRHNKSPAAFRTVPKLQTVPLSLTLIYQNSPNATGKHREYPNTITFQKPHHGPSHPISTESCGRHDLKPLGRHFEGKYSCNTSLI